MPTKKTPKPPKPVDPIAPTQPSMPAVVPDSPVPLAPSSSGEHIAVQEWHRQRDALDDLAERIERGEPLPPSTPPPELEGGPVTIRPDDLRQDNKPRQERVLVADDDALLGEQLKIDLQNEGYQVRVVYDGYAALGAILSKVRPDVVLLDIGMPVLSGNAVLAAMQADDIRIPVIVISAGNFEKLRSQNPELAEKFAFHKSTLDTDHLKAKIRALINEYRAIPR